MREVVNACLRGVGVIVVLASAACGSNSKPPGGDDDAGVDAASGHDIRIELQTSLGGTQNGQLVAIQDGDGPWTAITGTDGVYLAHISSDRFGAVSGCAYDPLDSFTQITLQTAADGTTVELPACDTLTDPVVLSGPIIGVSSDLSVGLWARAWSAFTTQADSYTFDLYPGTTDLFAWTESFERDVAGTVIRKPGLDVTVDQTLPLDFTADGVAFATAALTVDAPDPTLSSRTSVIVDGTVYRLARFRSSTSYQALPSSQSRPGDLTIVDVSTSDGRTSSLVGASGPLTVALPAPVTAPAPALIDDGYLRPRIVFPIGGGTLPIVSYEAEYFTFDEVSNRSVVWAVDMTAAWAGNETKIDFTVPDLSKLAGFDATMALEQHQAITGSTARLEATTQDMVAGRRSTAASSGWVIGSYCGDGIKDPSEACDDAGDSATCDSDCTLVSCGDGYTNTAAGEECDPPDGVTCSATCTLLQPPPDTRIVTRRYGSHATFGRRGRYAAHEGHSAVDDVRMRLDHFRLADR